MVIVEKYRLGAQEPYDITFVVKEGVRESRPCALA
jgi:hypothetical protein